MSRTVTMAREPNNLIVVRGDSQRRPRPRRLRHGIAAPDGMDGSFVPRPFIRRASTGSMENRSDAAV